MFLWTEGTQLLREFYKTSESNKFILGLINLPA